MSSANTALARRWFEEVWNQRRTDTIDELLTPESVCTSDLGTLRGPEGFKQVGHAPFLAAFPDLRIRVEGTVAEGDQVVVRWTLKATHTGQGLGIPPSGRPVAARGMTWIRYQNGKMMEGWDCWNVTGFLESLRSPGGAGPGQPQ
jgi:steroid delta-isomerase-like uncharacterized protein